MKLLLLALCFILVMCSVHRNSAQLMSTECLLASNGSIPLPNFVRPLAFPPRRFEGYHIQAIIPSYQFSCHGVITEWATFVHRVNRRVCYSISFEVWRPASSSCYDRVGANYFTDLCLERLDTEDPEQGLVNVTVPENERIFVEPGDVVGFNLTHTGGLEDNGIVFSDDELYTNELVFFEKVLVEQQSVCNIGQSFMNTTTLAPLITAQLETVIHTTMHTTARSQGTSTIPSLSVSPSITTSSPGFNITPTFSVSVSMDSPSPNALPVLLTAGVGGGVASLVLVVVLTVCMIGCCCVCAKRKREAPSKLSGDNCLMSTEKMQHSNDGDNIYEQVDCVSASTSLAQQNTDEQGNSHYANEEIEIMDLKMIPNEAYGDISTNHSMFEELLYDTVSVNNNYNPGTRESQGYVTVNSDTDRQANENNYEFLP